MITRRMRQLMDEHERDADTLLDEQTILGLALGAGVTGLRVSTRKPDIYPDCAGVGVELSSF